jgi:hypothetical protein
MESTLQKPALVAAKTTPKAKTIVYWIVTALFCLQMSFTAYAQLRLPQVAEAFTHLGFPAYFRVETPASFAGGRRFKFQAGSGNVPSVVKLRCAVSGTSATTRYRAACDGAFL